MIDFTKILGATEVYLKKGDTISLQDTPVENVHYLKKGIVQSTSVSETGEIIISEERTENQGIDSAINIVCLFNGGTCTANFVAKTECICYRIPKEAVIEAVRKDSDTLFQLVENAARKYNRTLSMLLNGQTKDAVCRLCEFLLAKVECKEDILCVPKRYTNAEISRFLGVHQVTASRIIKALKDEKVLCREKGCLIILDERKLRQYAEGKMKLIYS